MRGSAGRLVRFEFIHDPDSIDPEKLAFVKELKEVRRGRIAE